MQPTIMMRPLPLFAFPTLMLLTCRAAVSVELSDAALTGLNMAVSNIMQKRMERCFGGFFVSWSDPIITSNDLDRLCDLMYDSLPQHVSSIMSMLGYDVKQNEARSAHLIDKFFCCMTLFQLMSLARVRNKKHFKLWSSIGVTIEYDCSPQYATQRIPVFFGYFCTTDTLLKSTLPLCNPDEYYRRVDQAMEGNTAPTQFQVCIGVFDNSQKNQCFKFQRGGSSGHNGHLTSCAYLAPWQGASWKDVPIPTAVVIPITYIDQAVPSVAGMPGYKRLLDAVSVMWLLSSIIINPASNSIAVASEPTFDLSKVLKVMQHLLLDDETLVKFSWTIWRAWGMTRRIVGEPGGPGRT